MKKTFLTLGLMALSALPLMAGTETTITTIDSEADDGRYSAVVRYQGNTAVAYDEEGSLYLWIDDGAGEEGIANDGIKNGTEVVVIDEDLSTVGRDVEMIVHNDKLTIAYYDQTNDTFKLWHDDGTGDDEAGNGSVDEAEIRTYDLDVEDYKMMSYKGNLAVVFSLQGEGDTVQLWIDDDTAGDLVMDEGEVRDIESGIDLDGANFSLLLLDDKLAITYFDHDSYELRLWHDADGDDEASAEEITTPIDSETRGYEADAVVYNGNIAVFFTDWDDNNLYVWIDDGAGEGTAGDKIADSDEIRNIGYINSYYNIEMSAAVVDGKLVCVFSDTSDFVLDGNEDYNLAMWYDTNGNGQVDAGERQVIDAGSDESESDEVGRYSDIFVEGANMYITYEDNDNSNIKLATLIQESKAGARIDRRKSSGGGCIVTSQAGLMSALAALALMVLSFGLMKNKTVVSKQ